ncbi:cyclase family protein, partial [Candidatus Gracilibacteria bacterium]|nr:cyclase family protein [Candidatus Gracilibacteria bacterium]
LLCGNRTHKHNVFVFYISCPNFTTDFGSATSHGSVDPGIFQGTLKNTNPYIMFPEKNLTVSPDEFSIDHVPTIVTPRFFDGKETNRPDALTEIPFTNPETGEASHEQSADIKIFGFNGTALLTPKAFDNNCGKLNLDTVDRTKLRGPLLILDLIKDVQYGVEEILELLKNQEVSSVEGHIILFRTKLMEEVLKITDKRGFPDYERLTLIQKNRPGLTPEGALALQKNGRANAIMIDNISFESNETEGFHATQNLSKPEPDTGEFTPLIYHVTGTSADDFVEKHNRKNTRIEIGNPPKKQLSGHPVGVFVETSE